MKTAVMHLRVWLKEEIALDGVDFLHVAKINGLRTIDVVTVSCLSYRPHAPIETCSARSFIQYFNDWSVLDAVSWASRSPGDTPRCILAPSFYLHVVLWAVFCRLLIDIGCVHRRACTCNTNLHRNQHVDPKDIPSLSPQGTYKFYVFLSVPSPTDYSRFGNMFSPPASLAVGKQGFAVSNRLHGTALPLLKQTTSREPRYISLQERLLQCGKTTSSHTNLVSPTFISVDLHAYIALHCVNGCTCAALHPAFDMS